jgi:hypothetical protein
MSKLFFPYICSPERKNAQVAKLVDALCSGRSVRKDVLVRIQSWAPQKALQFCKAFLFSGKIS